MKLPEAVEDAGRVKFQEDDALKRDELYAALKVWERVMSRRTRERERYARITDAESSSERDDVPLAR